MRKSDPRFRSAIMLIDQGICVRHATASRQRDDHHAGRCSCGRHEDTCKELQAISQELGMLT